MYFSKLLKMLGCGLYNNKINFSKPMSNQFCNKNLNQIFNTYFSKPLRLLGDLVLMR